MPHNVGEDGNPSARVFLVGPSGSGKTVVGRRVAAQRGWRLYDTDGEILKRCEFSSIESIFDRKGESYFRDQESICIREVETIREPVVVATGGGLPGIAGVMSRLERLGTTIYLKAGSETLWKRLSTDPRQLADRPLLREHGQEALETLIKRREEFYERSAITLDTDQLSVDDVCAAVLGQMVRLNPS